ncbi:MAG: tetratricopeptide repeat protein, partial [Candidatus Xenobia bacterium]
MKCQECRAALAPRQLYCEQCGELAGTPLSPQELRALLEAARGLEPEVAQRLLQGLVAAEPDNAAVFNALGCVHAAQRSFVEAEACFKKALFLDGNLKPAVENLVALHGARGERDPHAPQLAACSTLPDADAIHAWDALIHQHPDAIDAYSKLGLLYLALGQHDSAERIFVRALERYYVHGLPVDHRYFVVKENLQKLRDAQEAGLGSVQEHLAVGERGLATVGGDLRGGGPARLVATNRRLLLNGETLHYEALSHAAISFGIVRAVLTLSSAQGDYTFSTLSKDAAKKALTIIRSMMRKTSETAVVDDLIVEQGDGVSS